MNIDNYHLWTMELYFSISTPSYKNIGCDKQITSQKNNFIGAIKKQHVSKPLNTSTLQSIIKEKYCPYLTKSPTK